MMKTAKLFFNGNSQAMRLPKEYRFSCDEVGINKVGEVVLLFPKDDAWANFLNTEPPSDDFGDAILEDRKEHYQSPREEL